MAVIPPRLGCLPQSLIVLASQRGIVIDPQEMWARFEPEFVVHKDRIGDAWPSAILDIGRGFNLFRRFDVTHRVSGAEGALKEPDVFGVLFASEAFRGRQNEMVAHRHISVLQSIAPRDSDTPESGRMIWTLSVQTDDSWMRVGILEHHLCEMMASFWILLK